MVNLSLYNKNEIKIDASYDYLRYCKEHFSFWAEGYQFSPKYEAGIWDGKISLFKNKTRTLPYGLLTDILQFHKKRFPDEHLSIDPKIKELFQGFLDESFQIPSCKVYQYRGYQESAIRKALQYKKCIIRMATSAGKTLTLYGVSKSLLQLYKDMNIIVIVPTLGLINQFCNDFIEYGFSKRDIGVANSSKKEWEKRVVVSTWQTLQNSKDQLWRYGAVLVDECHGSKAKELSDILQQTDAQYKIGCTGTLPDNELQYMNIKSYLGPVVVDISYNYLAQRGYVAPCFINMVHIYPKQRFSPKYNDAKREIFKNEFRLRAINWLCRKISDTCLFLVGRVETEGEFLKEYIESTGLYKKENIIFISGKMKADEREEWRKKFHDETQKYAIIATYGVFQMGVNIPRLSNLVFAAPFISKIRILQSIGRTIRKHAKKEGAKIYDLVDHGNRWFPENGDTRLRFYQREKFSISEITLREDR